MHIPNPYFSNIPQLGNLTLDYIFVEDGYPILFTCRNGAKIYICLCRTLSPMQKWIISETSIAILKKLAQQDIPICDAFTQLGTKSCIAQWSKANPVEQYSVISTSDLSSDDLPDKDVFWTMIMQKMLLNMPMLCLEKRLSMQYGKLAKN